MEGRSAQFPLFTDFDSPSTLYWHFGMHTDLLRTSKPYLSTEAFEAHMTEEQQSRRAKRVKLTPAEKEKRNEILKRMQHNGEFEQYVGCVFTCVPF
eukprot:scaffold1669_cov129-Cylindrotheca_fusiformis.AAC.18